MRLLAVIVLALLLAACGGGDETPRQAPAAQSPWLALLANVPDTPENRKLIVLNDYAAMRKLANSEAPRDAAAVAEYRKALLTVGNVARPSHISGLGQYFDPHLWMAQVGFHGGLVDADLQYGEPPNNVEVLRGRFDAAAIDTAIDKDGSPARSSLTETSREGATVYIWGADLAQNIQARSVLRPLGRGGRLGLKGDTLFWGYATMPVNDAIDTAAGKKPSVAQAADAKALVNELSKQSVYSAILSTESLTPDGMDVIGRDPSVVREAREASVREALKPYTMLAIAYGSDTEGSYSVLILQHANEALARENLTKLRDKIENGRSAQTRVPWKDQITKYDASVNGVFVVARMRTSSLSLLADSFFKRDSLLVHE